MKCEKIQSIQYFGIDETYDIEVDSQEHTFFANGISVSNSHAVAYSYNSYQCAWLFTYYPDQWIKACLEYDPDLEKTITVVAGLGYQIQKPSVNDSEASEWSVKGAVCVPALTAIKGIGVTAASELVRLRPRSGFASLRHFFFCDAGIWRWSKFNKKAIEALIKVEGLPFSDDIGSGKLFKNYRHLFNTLFEVEKFDKLKKNWENIENAAVLADSEDWPVSEKINIQKEIIGFYDKNLIVGNFLEAFKEFGVQAIDESDDEKNKTRVWGLIEQIQKKKTVSDTVFLSVTASGISSKSYNFRVWNPNLEFWKEGEILILNLEYDKQYGYSVPRHSKIIKVNK